MLQMSKLIKSREEWKSKAVQRENEIREYRKTTKRHQEKIRKLKERLAEMELAASDKKKPYPQPIINIDQAQQTRLLCIRLILQAVVSFRSVPRILKVFNEKTPLSLEWIPHFTSVISFPLRLGLGMLREVQPICQHWIAIIDHSIDIGTKKALVVLRVKVNALSKRQKAITLKDCECIGVKVSERVNGETLSQELEEIFNRAGIPKAIVKDCDATLEKGVRLWAEKQESDILGGCPRTVQK